MKTKTVRVPDISCGRCVAKIERVLKGVPGVIEANGEPAGKTLTIQWDDSRLEWEKIRSTMETIRYPVEER